MKLFQRLRGSIETQRLLLRRWEHKDFQAYVQIVSDPEVMVPAGCQPAGTLEAASAMFARDLRNDLCYAIVLKDAGEVIGRFKFQSDLRRFHVNSLSVGYEMCRGYWGMGYMTEALAAMITYAFEKKKVDVLAVSHYSDNERSRRVIEKCGFKLEGVVPWASRRFDGRICDDVCYSILREDYINGLDANSQAQLLS